MLWSVVIWTLDQISGVQAAWEDWGKSAENLFLVEAKE